MIKQTGGLIDILYQDIELTVSYNLSPEEQATYDYPGCATELTINKIVWDGKDVYDLLNALSTGPVDIIEEIAYETIETLSDN